MLKLQKNRRNDLYTFFWHHDVRKVTCLTAKFLEGPIEPIREIAWRRYGVYDEHSSFGVVKKCWQKTGCQRFTTNVMQTSFQQIFSIR